MTKYSFKKGFIVLLLLLPFVVFAQTDPLPSWNEGKLKSDILKFVTTVTTEGASGFVPIQDRIATFDNDGTLWCEKPIIQVLFSFYRVKKMVEKNPALSNKQPYKAIVANDWAYIKSMPEGDLIKLVVSTQTGMTQDELAKDAADFFANGKTPSGKSIATMVYQPQVELLKLLRDNGFTVYICTGGDVDFVRSISEQYYNIKPEHVIGSTFKTVYKDSAGVNDLVRLPAMNQLNDKQEKPVSIQRIIGKRPILACGNEGGAGDVYMLRYSQGSKYPSMQFIVNHDDKDRESYYQEKDNLSLNWAKKYNWYVISMKTDWNTIFVK